MYYGRKKIIYIIIGIIVAIAVLAAAGFFVYMKTDLLKSSKTLFWKYANLGVGSYEIKDNTQLIDAEKMKLQKPYNSKIEVSANTTNNIDEISDILNNLKLILNTEVDKNDSYCHAETKVNYSNNEFFKLDYVQNDNLYALKSDEIVTAYIGIKNENLKVLAQKLGITNTDYIPDEISNTTDYLDMLELTEADIKHIEETYTPIIGKSIPETNYSKQTEAVIEKDGISYNTTSYRLDLSGDEIKNIIINIFNELKNDSITLELIRAKINILTDEGVSIEEITDAIDDVINNIEDETFIDMSFVVYAHKGETIATEIILKNEAKITIYLNNQTAEINIQNLGTEDEYENIKIEFTNKISTIDSNIILNIDIDSEIELNLTMDISGSATQGIINTTINGEFVYDGETTEISYTEELEFVDELDEKITLDSTNCAVLNDYSQNQLSPLIEALSTQTINVITKKAVILGLMEPTVEEEIQVEE